MNALIAQGIADHWYLLLAAWWLWRWWENEKRQRIEADRQRKEDERVAREEQREEIRTVVRDEIATHARSEESTFTQIREAVSSLVALVRQHEDRIRFLEEQRRRHVDVSTADG